MNDNHLQQIFAHYIEQFERINNPNHQEYYKWQIAKRFHNEMDAVNIGGVNSYQGRMER